METTPFSVLVVDDEDALREVLSLRIADWGFDVRTAADVAEGERFHQLDEMTKPAPQRPDYRGGHVRIGPERVLELGARQEEQPARRRGDGTGGIGAAINERQLRDRPTRSFDGERLLPPFG